jgi:hypothetical protein
MFFPLIFEGKIIMQIFNKIKIQKKNKEKKKNFFRQRDFIQNKQIKKFN